MAKLTDQELLFLSNLMHMRKQDVVGKDNKIVENSPFEDLWKEENQGVTIKELLQNVKVNDLRNNKALRKYIFDGEISGSEWADMIEAIRNSEISNLKLKKVTVDEKRAISTYFEDEEGKGYVVYRGTGGGEWKDNFAGGYESDTEQQKRALYFIESIKNDGLTVVGHSKGGNKAKYVTIMSNKVERCVSFDGQGFSKDFFDKYKDRVQNNKSKIMCYALDNDFVNILLYDIYNKKLFIEGNGVDCFAQNHSPNSFFSFEHDKDGHVTNYTFRKSKQGKALKTFHEFTNYVVCNTNEKERKKMFAFLGDIAEMALGTKETGEKYTKKEIDDYIKKPKNFLQLITFLSYVREYESYDNKISDAIIEILCKEFGKDREGELLKVIKNILIGIAQCRGAAFVGYKQLLKWRVHKVGKDYDLNEEGIVRDYSKEMRDILLDLTHQVASEKKFDIRKWDGRYRVEKKLGLLKKGTTKEDEKKYYRKLIDIHDTSPTQMQEIFENVDAVESGYNKELEKLIIRMKEISQGMKAVL